MLQLFQNLWCISTDLPTRKSKKTSSQLKCFYSLEKDSNRLIGTSALELKREASYLKEYVMQIILYGIPLWFIAY